MSLQTLKYEIIEWITRTEDSSLLNALKSIKESNSKNDWFEKMTHTEIESINRGLKNHENGEVLSSEEFWSENAKGL